MAVLSVAWLVCTRPAADMLLSSLENRYSQPSVSSLQEKGLKDVVVLTGGGYRPTGELLSSALPHGSIYRFVGGMELANRLGSKEQICFSGAAGRDRSGLKTGDHMKQLAQVLMPAREVISESASKSTEEHPKNVRALLGDKSFILVTSAYHMPRAMLLFQREGLNPVAYPVDYLSRPEKYSMVDWLPSAESLWKLQIGLREYLALGYYSLKRIIR
ncbi:MAG: YdcF family protein [Smithella sp.]|nr:YdcF family protein [Smithella sp.]